MAENKDDEMYSMSSYEDAKNKYGTGVGNNKYFMPKSTWEKRKAEYNKKVTTEKPNEKAEPKKQQSLVANQFGAKKEKTWNDVKSEYNNDPAKIADYLNNAKDYTPGNLTKKGMEGFGYIQGEDGKWAAKPKTTTPTTETKTTTPATDTKSTGTTTDTKSTGTTTDDAITGVEGITKEDPKAKGFVDGVTNKDGSVNEQKAYDAMSQYEQKLVEMGAGSFDEDGKFVFKDTTKKGWEDFATMLSVGASVIGIAMGVPILPVNFRKITNKDEKDAKIREFQKQYTDIMAGNAAKVKDVESSAEAGKLAKANESDINAYSKYKEDVGAYKAKSDIDSESQKDLIDAQSQSRLKELQAQQLNNEALLKLEQAHAKDMAKLSSDLSTASAKELTAYGKTGWVVDYVKELQAQGLSNKDIALAIAGLGGTTPTQMGLKNAESIVGMVKDVGETASSLIPGKGN